MRFVFSLGSLHLFATKIKIIYMDNYGIVADLKRVSYQEREFNDLWLLTSSSLIENLRNRSNETLN